MQSPINLNPSTQPGSNGWHGTSSLHIPSGRSSHSGVPGGHPEPIEELDDELSELDDELSELDGGVRRGCWKGTVALAAAE